MPTDGSYKLGRPTMEYFLIPQSKKGFPQELDLPPTGVDQHFSIVSFPSYYELGQSLLVSLLFLVQ